MNKQDRLAQRQQWREQEATEIEDVKNWLSLQYDVPRDRRFDIAWGIACGHASGIEEAKVFFSELVDLLKP